MNKQLWIEPVGDILIARLRGVPTKALLQECQDRVLALANETEQTRVLYDALEMEIPSVEIPLFQAELEKENQTIPLRRAIVVTNTRLAYLARIAFGDGDYRVFYNDILSAMRWLTEESAPKKSPHPHIVRREL